MVGGRRCLCICWKASHQLLGNRPDGTARVTGVLGDIRAWFGGIKRGPLNNAGEWYGGVEAIEFLFFAQMCDHSAIGDGCCFHHVDDDAKVVSKAHFRVPRTKTSQIFKTADRKEVRFDWHEVLIACSALAGWPA